MWRRVPGELRLAALLAACLFTFVACGTGSGSSQRDFVESMSDARKQLFEGQLTYTNTEKLRLVAGEPRFFHADVTGRWHPPSSGDSSTTVRAGAQIGVRLHCSGAGLSCTPLSSERQSVLTKNDRATWRWKVTAKGTGEVALNLTVTAYYGDTDTVLAEKPITALAAAAPAPGASGPFSWLTDTLTWIKNTAVDLGAVAGALVTVWGLYIAVSSRRPRADEEEPAAPDDNRDPVE
ncbi:hypothetical protein [Streptomyces hokutonensis]|uniref:hypothetical protein n=1 Tax=Streptomyces hokutonensis TaxID=1306990 RepID=UPI00381BD79E